MMNYWKNENTLVIDGKHEIIVDLQDVDRMKTKQWRVTNNKVYSLENPPVEAFVFLYQQRFSTHDTKNSFKNENCFDFRWENIATEYT
jgi:hypothetical protein